MNDLQKHGKPRDLLRDIRLFEDVVSLYGFKGSYQNTFTAATLPYPPRLCWMPEEAATRPVSFDCHYKRIQLLNVSLSTMTANNGNPALDFSGYGVRQGRNGRLVSDFSQWRELHRNRMLHLNDETRLVCAAEIWQYFRLL